MSTVEYQPLENLPSQGEYAPPQGGYILRPPQEGYVPGPPQGGYVLGPSQGGYEPSGLQQGGYVGPPQGGYVPPAFYPQQGYAPPQQQATTNVIMVKAQPKAATVTTVTRTHSTGDYYYTLSFVMIVVCSAFGGLCGLMCIIPALFLAISAKKDARNGKTSSAKTKGYVALGLNIIAIFSYIGILIISISVAATSISASSLPDYYLSYYDSYYYDYYYYYYYYLN